MKYVAVMLYALVALLPACIQPDTPKVISPAAGIYVGTADNPPPAASTRPVLPDNIIISYPSNPGSINLYLNGQPIGNKLSYGQTQATVPFSAVLEFIRQGKNTLTVNPESLGPTSTFFFDNAGPRVIIDNVSCSDGNCQQVDGGLVTVSVKVVDPSLIDSVVLSANSYLWEGGTDAAMPSFKTGAVVNGTAYPMSNNGGGYYSVIVPESTMYTFTSTDQYGYQSTVDYLSEGQKINSVFKMRIGKTLLDSMIPVMEPQMDNLHIYSQVAMDQYGKPYPADPLAAVSQSLDSMNAWWSSDAIFYGDIGSATANASDCGYVNNTDTALNSSNFTCTNVKTDKKDSSKKYCLQADLKPNASRPDAKNGRCTRVVTWRLKLDDVADMKLTLSDSVNGRLALDMKIKDSVDAGSIALETDLGMRHVQCLPRHTQTSFCANYAIGICWSSENGIALSGTSPAQALTMAPTSKHLGGANGYCKDDGAASYLGIGLGDLDVTATAANPKGNIDAVVKNGALNLNVDKSTFKLNMSGLKIGAGGVIDWFVSALSGVLDGMFVDIVVGVVKQNMTDFKLGFDIFTQSGSTLRMQSQAYQVFTNADNNPATPTEWYMFYSGFLKPFVPHPEVASPLGTYFKRTDIAIPLDNPGSAVDNFSIAISSNIINQGLASIYRSGMMHFTITNYKKDGKAAIVFGPDATSGDTGIQQGDTRVTLTPRSPAIFEMVNGASGTQATLNYQGATMDADLYVNGAWQTIFHAKVNIEAGVLMSVVDQKFHMTIAGTPRIDILELLDLSLSIPAGTGNGFSGSIFVSKIFLESAINLVIEYAIPFVAESFMVIDVPDIPGPLNSKVITTTEGFEANNGAHLGFSMGLNLEN